MAACAVVYNVHPRWHATVTIATTITWKEWSAALAAELTAAADRGEPDDGSRYYEYWLTALERLVTEKGLTDLAALVERKEAWADAYRHTPHGKPVELRTSR